MRDRLTFGGRIPAGPRAPAAAADRLRLRLRLLPRSAPPQADAKVGCVAAAGSTRKRLRR